MGPFRKSFVIVLTLGVALSVLIALQFHQARVNSNKEIFKHIARQQYQYITKNIAWHMDALASAGGYFRASHYVNNAEFQIFAASLMNSDESYEALGWIAPSGARNGVYDVRHVRSRPGYGPRAGYKVSADPVFAALIDAAQKGRGDKNFAGIYQGENPSGHALLLMLHPATALDAVKRTEGFAFGMVNLSRMTGRPQEPGYKPYSALEITAKGPGGEETALHKSPEQGLANRPYIYLQTLDLNGVTLNFKFLPTQYFLSVHSNYQGFLVFGFLLLMTIAAAFYVEQMHKNMAMLEDAKRMADESNRIKNEFLATMSHEIRSPMTGVLGMAELLIESDLNAEQRNYTRTILNSAEALLTIINDILDFSRIEAQRLELEPMPINLLELVDDLSDLYSIKAREKALELAVRYVPGTEQFVYADPTRLRQVLGNLINNAIKFTEKGSIVVTVRERRDTANRPDHAQFIFTVEDTGIGIPQDAQGRIFEKFVQLDASAKRDVGGMGLGLAICKRLVALMGGDLRVESTPGKGSTFTFTADLRRNTEEHYAPIKPAILKDVKCLIVDDLSVIRTVVCEQLNLAGMRCAGASGGEEALEMILQARAMDDPYKIILADYLMPGMDGEALARMMSDLPGGGDTCLIMLTGAGIPVVAEEFVRKGFSAHISKPVKGRLLAESLAVIWRRYKEGETKNLIRIDAHALQRTPKRDDIILEGARVLLAEDSRINQAFAEDTLAHMHCSVTIVPNGQEAVKIVQEQEFDLVLMDCQMPVMDGFEATRQICALKKAGRVAAHLPIIALTANSMRGDRERCQEAGMDDYLAKPVRSRELKEKVHSWITRTRDKAAEPARGAASAANVVPFAKGEQGAEGILNESVSQEARRLLKDRYGSIMNAYLEDTEAYLHEIEQCMADGDMAAAVRPAHTIKSSSRHMGAMRLTEQAEELEKFLRSIVEGGREMNGTQLSQRLADVQRVFEETRTALQRQQAV